MLITPVFKFLHNDIDQNKDLHWSFSSTVPVRTPFCVVSHVNIITVKVFEYEQKYKHEMINYTHNVNTRDSQHNIKNIRRQTAQSPHQSISFPITLFSSIHTAYTYIILARNYKSCYALDVMHLKNSETKVCRRRCTNHIRISLGNYGSLTSQLNLSFYLVRSLVGSLRGGSFLKKKKTRCKLEIKI